MEKWPEIKRKYAKSNVVLMKIPKVLMSSKVMGDLDQLMVSQDLSLEEVFYRAEELEFPESMFQPQKHYKVTS